MNLSLLFENLFAYSFQIALIVITGAALAFLFRLRLPNVLHPYWQSLFVACVCLPALQPWKQVIAGSVRVAATGAVPIDAAATAGGTSKPDFPVYETLAVILVAGILMRLVWLTIGLYRLSRYRRNAKPLPGPPDSLAEMQDRVGVHAPFYVSTEIDSPVTFGWRRPVILIPESFLEMDESYQKAIACHELLHIRRRDWLYAIAEEVVGALFWFHPAMGWLLRKIQLSREQVVDFQVLQVTGARHPYLQSLLLIARLKEQAGMVPAPRYF